MKGYHQMNSDERQRLDALRRVGISVAECARQLGFSRQTIYNELRRGECDVVRMRNGYYHDVKEYSADKGQQIHEQNNTAKGRPLKIGHDREYADYLEKKMLGVQEDGTVDPRKRYSPAAALAAARAEGFQTAVSVNTLYSYIDKGIFVTLSNKDLWQKGKKNHYGHHRKKQEKKIAHPLLPCITDRPQIISDRGELGHKEIDLIVGCKGSKAAVLTITDRLSREEMAFKIPDKQTASVQAVFNRIERRLGKKRFRKKFKSISTDNGPEFLGYEGLTKSIFNGKRIEVYYCHPYSAWEKGTNENGNRMLRRFFPKGTNFEKITQQEIQDAVDWLNHYPRKILGWKCAADLAENP